jgi:Fe2+ transport system protein FeoA
MISRVRAAAKRRRAEKDMAAAEAAGAVVMAEARAEVRLGEIPLREMVELVRIDLPSDEVEPLLELGLLPGCQLCPVRRSPFGDPVLMVDGALIAVRREMAGCLCVRRAEPATN